MDTVTSKDGTTIAFDRLGDGPPVILVCGGSTDRMANAPLAELLAEHFTVFNYDRRGRGDSGDAAPYAVEREVEDLDAVIDAAGRSAFVYGTSSGGALALEAAASGLAITKLAIWEPPFSLDESSRPPADQVQRYNEMISAGHRGDAVEYFMTKVVASRPSSSPTRAPSHSGRNRKSWRTRSPTTLPSWATIPCRSSGRHPLRHRRL
jgi:pimeloyl-ACP methyl ester carboxylesterase